MSRTREELITFTDISTLPSLTGLKGKPMENTLFVSARPLLRWTRSIVTANSHRLKSTEFIIEQFLFVCEISAIVFAINKELLGKAHSVQASIFIVFTFIDFQCVTIPFTIAKHALLHAIADVTPIETEKTRITDLSRVTYAIARQVDQISTETLHVTSQFQCH